MRVKITFVIKAESLDHDPTDGGAGKAEKLFEVPFYNFIKQIDPKKLRPYIGKLKSGLTGFANVATMLNNAFERGG